jgi:hypothetical protein
MRAMTEPDASSLEAQILTALERLEERPVADYPAEVQGLFADIRSTLRIPFEGLLFRLLAKDPPILAATWKTLRGSLRNRHLEREADRLRASALFIRPHPDLGAEHRTALVRQGLDPAAQATISRLNETVQYGLSKLLIVAAAGARSLHGERVGGSSLVREEDRRELEPGVPDGAVAPDPLPLGTAPAEVRAGIEALRDLHGHRIVSSYFQALGRWPAYLERARTELALVVGTGRFRSAAQTLSTLAEVAAKGLGEPVRIEVGGALPRAVVEAFFTLFHERLLPDLLLDVTYLRALDDGVQAALANRFSLTELHPPHGA